LKLNCCLLLSLQDWRTYPAARFISEYGWQSYPSWATYSAATAAEDWAVAADMTEFRWANVLHAQRSLQAKSG
jgi:hypothetical protein